MKTGKKDLLKEAIADAKAVKETALANAKIALEEAFTPRLQSMLSHKLAEELEDDETLATEEDEMMMDTEEGYGEGYEGEEDETMTTEEDEMGGEEDETMTTEEEDEGVDESKVNEGKTTVVIDYNTDDDDLRYVSNILKKAGIKAKVLAGLDSEEVEVTIETSDLKKATKALSANGLELQESVVAEAKELSSYKIGDEEEDMSDLDLESIIKELEAEMGGEEDETMTTEEEEEMENPEITELKRIRERISKRLTELESSGIGTGDNKVTDLTGGTEYPEEGDFVAEEEEGDEEVNLDEVIRALREMNGDVPAEDEEDTAGMTEEEAEEMKSDLEEAYKVIKSLKNTINEVNLLNAKLLYTNKLFRNFDLNEKQKVKVVENFDRASSLREVKLVFATLGENLNVARKTQNRVVKESFASRPTKGTKPAGIITEGSSLAMRFQKLANIKK